MLLKIVELQWPSDDGCWLGRWEQPRLGVVTDGVIVAVKELSSS